MLPSAGFIILPWHQGATCRGTGSLLGCCWGKGRAAVAPGGDILDVDIFVKVWVEMEKEPLPGPLQKVLGGWVWLTDEQL